MNQIPLPLPCMKCPNLEALRLALLENQLELTRERLAEILSRIDGSCGGKCAGVSVDSSASTENEKTPQE